MSGGRRKRAEALADGRPKVIGLFVCRQGQGAGRRRLGTTARHRAQVDSQWRNLIAPQRLLALPRQGAGKGQGWVLLQGTS
eukprot:205206-Pelagomonas_calceolata.AAC.1